MSLYNRRWKRNARTASAQARQKDDKRAGCEEGQHSPRVMSGRAALAYSSASPCSHPIRIICCTPLPTIGVHIRKHIHFLLHVNTHTHCTRVQSCPIQTEGGTPTRAHLCPAVARNQVADDHQRTPTPPSVTVHIHPRHPPLPRHPISPFLRPVPSCAALRQKFVVGHQPRFHLLPRYPTSPRERRRRQPTRRPAGSLAESKSNRTPGTLRARR